MKLLSLSLDAHILDPKSVVASRIVRYEAVLHTHAIIVPAKNASKRVLSDATMVYATGGSIKLTQYIRTLFLAVRLMQQERFEVISSQDAYFLGALGALLAKMYHCGLEIQVHGIEKHTRFRSLLARFAFSRAGSIRTVSTRLQNWLIETYNIDARRIITVPIYVDVSSLGFGNSDVVAQNARSFTELYADRFNILCVNRLVPIKNIPLQLQAIHTLKAAFPNIMLHIVGDGPQKQVLQQQIDTLDLAAHVTLHGAQFGAKLGALYTGSDCFVLTSNFEGYGMTVIEAAHAGLPIVMTDVGCAGEVLKHDESALIVPTNNHDALVAALRTMITDGALRTRLHTCAKEAVLALPTFEETRKKYQTSWEQARSQDN